MWHLFARDSKNVVYESRGAEKPFLFLTWDVGHLPRPGNQEATEDKTNKTKKRKKRMFVTGNAYLEHICPKYENHI